MKISKYKLAPIAAAVILLGGAISVLAFPFGQGEGSSGPSDSSERRVGPPSRHGRPESGRSSSRHGPPPHHGARADLSQQEDRLRELGATDEQIGKVAELEHDVALKRADLRAHVEKAEVSLRYAMRVYEADESAVITAIDALNEARGHMFKQDTLFRLNVRNILGDDVLKAMRPPRHREESRPPLEPGPKPAPVAE